MVVADELEGAVDAGVGGPLVLFCACQEGQRSVWYRARMHNKVVGNFGSEADIRSLYFRGFRFNKTSDNGACTHGQPAK